LIGLLICGSGVSDAGIAYPIPFSDKADWRGIIVNPPARAAAVMRKKVMGHSVILVTFTTLKSIDEREAARLAYQNLFSNAKRLPNGSTYVVVVVYGPPTVFGVHEEYAYVFRRETGKDGWRPRPVSGKELLAIECAIGHCPNGQI
jgi:hypothetical protein